MSALLIQHCNQPLLRLLLTLLAVSFGVSATRAAEVSNPPPVLAILPLANHARDVTAPDTVNPILRRLLTETSLTIREAGQTRQVLRRHRIRAIGVIDRAGARALVSDLGVDFLITGSIDLFATGRFPEAMLSLRLVDAHSLRVIWAQSMGATGDDFTTVFGLGSISAISALIERFLPDAIRTIESAALSAVPTPKIHDITYDILVTATDSLSTDSQWVSITVSDQSNAQPELHPVGTQTARAKLPLAFTVRAGDPEGSRLFLSIENSPALATWTDHGNGTATFAWTPSESDTGCDTVLIIASDGIKADSEHVALEVASARNHSPHLSRLRALRTIEGVPLSFEILATDLDLTIPKLRAKDLPDGATFTDRGDGTGFLLWTPGFADAGAHQIRFIASDGRLAHTNVLRITVIDAGNQVPRLLPLDTLRVSEDTKLCVLVGAEDPDRTLPTLRVGNLPEGATFEDNGDGTGLLEWLPSLGSAGKYDVFLVASDSLLTDSVPATISVREAGNRQPEISLTPRQCGVEREAITISFSATDPDGSLPTLTATDLPDSASFIDLGDGHATFEWTPGFADAGVYDLTIIASDGILHDSTVVSLVVNDCGNQRPVLDSIGMQSVTENETLQFHVAAADSDATALTLSVDGAPVGAQFTDHRDGTGHFVWTPSFTDAGIYELTIVATDGFLADSELVVLKVAGAGNQPPVIAQLFHQGVTETRSLRFDVTARDPDQTVPVLNAVRLPRGAVFTDNGDGTALFKWTPGEVDDLARQRIALIGFDHMTPETEGGPIVSDAVLSELVQRGFVVVDPGAVRGLSLAMGRSPLGSIDHELMTALYDTLGVTTVVTAMVGEFQPSRASTELSFPSVTLSGRCVETRTGHIHTFSDVARSGNREHILGLGRTRSMTKVVHSAATAFLDGLGLKDGLDPKNWLDLKKEKSIAVP